MQTDWNLIRAMLSATVDACERLDRLNLRPEDRDGSVNIGGQNVSIQDILISACTYPEKIRYQIIRQRHEQGNDAPYVPDAARVIIAMATAASELIGAGEKAPPGMEEDINKMISWFETHAPESVERALSNKRAA